MKIPSLNDYEKLSKNKKRIVLTRLEQTALRKGDFKSANMYQSKFNDLAKSKKR